MAFHIFTEPNQWAYCVIAIGRVRIGWYHGIGKYSAWVVRS